MTDPISRADKAPVIWMLTDNKAGHLNQLKGVGNRLRVLTGASLYWIDSSLTPVPLWRALLGVRPAPGLNLPHPRLIIAAGSGTHRLLLALRRLRGARTIVIMKPAFPMNWIDAAVLPEHDNVAPSDHILLTEGVINTITPLARLTDKPEGLILVGGPSRHYRWDSDLIFDQVTQLMGLYPSWRWTLSGSRRTPTELQQRFLTLAGPKVTVVDPSQTHDSWLSHTFAASRAVWVTPDSGSMVYEAVTSGIPTGLFELEAVPRSRVVRGNARLLDQGRIAGWRDHPAIMGAQRQPPKPLWEADRSARWLINTQLTRTPR